MGVRLWIKVALKQATAIKMTATNVKRGIVSNSHYDIQRRSAGSACKSIRASTNSRRFRRSLPSTRYGLFTLPRAKWVAFLANDT